MAERKPWSVKGIDTRARAAALEAARAEGVTLGDYINKLLLESTEEVVEEEFKQAVNMGHNVVSTRAESAASANRSYPIPNPTSAGAGTNISDNLDWLTAKIEAIEGRSTLAITGIDKSLMGLLARVESVESSQNDTGSHMFGVLEDVKGTQNTLSEKIKALESDDSAKRNLDIIKSLEQALGKLAAEMYRRHEALEQNRLGVDDRLEALDRRNVDFTGKIRESEEKLNTQFETYTNALETRLERGLTAHDSRLEENETRQRQALSESECRQRNHISELEERTEDKLNKGVKEAKSYVEAHTNTALNTLEGELSERLEKAVQDQSQALVEFEARQEEVFERERKASAETEARVEKLEVLTTERFEGLKKTTIDTIDTLTNSLKSTQANIAEVRRTQTLEKDELDRARARVKSLADKTEKQFFSVNGALSDNRDTLGKIKSRIDAQHAAIQEKVKSLESAQNKGLAEHSEKQKALHEEMGEAISEVQSSITQQEQKYAASEVEIITRLEDTEKNILRQAGEFEALQSELIAQINDHNDGTQSQLNDLNSALSASHNAVANIENRQATQGDGLDQTMNAVGELADKVGNLTKRAEKAEASTDAALNSLVQHLAKLEDHIKLGQDSSQNLFEAFAKKIEDLVDQNRAALAEEIQSAIARTETLEQRFDNEKPASVNDVQSMRDSFDALKKRVTSGEINQAATLSTISREIDAFTEKFEERLGEAEKGISGNAVKASDNLRAELIDFSKAIQDRIGKVEVGLHELTGMSDNETRSLSQHVQNIEQGFAQRLQEVDERSQRAIEHVGQQVAAASARSQHKQEEVLSEFEGRFNTIEQRTEERLSSALTNISERLEQIQTQTSTTTAPLQKSVSELSERIDAIEDFKSPSHAKSAPRVQAAEQGAGNADAYRPNLGPPMGGGPDAYAMHNTSSTGFSAGSHSGQAPSSRGSMSDFRQSVTASIPASSEMPPMMESTAGNQSNDNVPVRSQLKKYAPMALLGVAGLAGASFLLRGPSSPDPVTRNSAPVSTQDPARVGAIGTGVPADPDLAGSEALLEAYDIQINAARVDPAYQVQNTAPPLEVEEPDPVIVSALTNFPPISYSKPISAEQAAASGDANAQLVVARKRAERGDAAGAADMLEKASIQGQGMAQYLLGQMYDMGQGVSKNPQKAFELSKQAAQSGNFKAMHDYGAYLHEGQFAPANNKDAAKWFKSAAEGGVIDSQFNLGLMYMDGIGVDQSAIEALFWLSLAKNAGDSDAGEIIKTLKSKLNPTSTAQVEARVKNWKKKTGKRAANGRLGVEPWNHDAKKTIVEIQKALNIMGYDAGTPDGALGPKTAAAIRSFERDNGMGETGRLNEGLVHTLNAKIRESGR